MAALEAMLAIPLVLLVGLGALQFGLVLHARQAVMHAATEAVRSGAVGHAMPSAIERGLARGLSPWFHGAASAQEHLLGIERTQGHLREGIAAGWVRWRQLSPTAASLRDWGVPVLDAQGRPSPRLREIPTDNLAARSWQAGLAGGSGMNRQGDDPIGPSSGQTLSDANLLKIEFTYGAPLNVPLVGRFAAWLMRQVDGCAEATRYRLGTLDLGSPPRMAAGRSWTCAFYEARSATGDRQPRWPLRVAAIARMQQPARSFGYESIRIHQPLDDLPGGQSNADRPPSGVAPPAGPSGPSEPHAPALHGMPPSTPRSEPRPEGFLQLGGTRPWPAGPGACQGAG